MLGGLAADDAADGLNNLHDALGGGQALEAGYGIELVERAAGDAEPAPGDHRHTKPKARQQGSQRQRDFVSDPAGGMLVNQRARVGGKTQHIPGVAHGAHERARLHIVQAPEIDRHEERGHLVIRHPADGVG